MTEVESPLVEIRMPTYKRPKLLARALRSLISQTHTNWRCIVLDDSPTQEGRDVCIGIGDPRIIYKPNEKNVGICQNIDNAFSLLPLEGTKFISVLEDDNYYLPDNIRSNILCLEEAGLDVLLRNQSVEHFTVRDEPGFLSGASVYADQYKTGILSHKDLFSSFFYSTGASNSSLFWRAEKGLDFSTFSYLDDVVAQERLRTLCIDRPVFIGIEPLIVWRDNGSESLRPKLGGLRWYVMQARAAMQERAIYLALYDYLVRTGHVEKIYRPSLGKFDKWRERVFRRVGLPVPRHLSKFTRFEQFMMKVKCMGAMVITQLFGHVSVIKISASTGRLA